MRWSRVLPVAALAVLAQTTLMRLLVLGDARPDLIAAMLATFALGATPAEGFGIGCFLGLGRDVWSDEPFGLSTGLFAVLGWVVASRRPSAYAERFLSRALFGFLCSAAASGASLLALLAHGRPPAPALVVRVTLLTALATAVLAAAAGALVWRWARGFGLRRRSGFE